MPRPISTAAEEQLKILGVDKDHPSSVVDVYAPISGVIIGQNVTNAAAAGVTLSGSATAFTIADLIHGLDPLRCLRERHPQTAAWPGSAASNSMPTPIAPSPAASATSARCSIPRCAPPRCASKLHNPGFLKLGMFVTATFTSRKTETHAVVPADAVLHLHDRDWVFVPAGGNQFKRTEVHAGKMLERRIAR